MQRNLVRSAKQAPTLLRQLRHSATYAMRASTPLLRERPSARAALLTLIP